MRRAVYGMVTVCTYNMEANDQMTATHVFAEKVTWNGSLPYTPHTTHTLHCYWHALTACELCTTHPAKRGEVTLTHTTRAAFISISQKAVKKISPSSSARGNAARSNQSSTHDHIMKLEALLILPKEGHSKDWIPAKWMIITIGLWDRQERRGGL